jgi:dolichyl-phosphate-mannose--protein O-mannosyl transferase
MYRRSTDGVLNLTVLGIIAGYLPWFFFQQRTVFTFYAIIFEPFVLLALIYCAKLILDSAMQARTSIALVATAMILIFLNFIYFLPLFTGEIINYDDWLKRMWLSSWI